MQNPRNLWKSSGSRGGGGGVDGSTGGYDPSSRFPRPVSVTEHPQHFYLLEGDTYSMLSYHYEKNILPNGYILCTGDDCLACRVGYKVMTYHHLAVYSIDRHCIEYLRVPVNDKNDGLFMLLEPYGMAERPLDRSFYVHRVKYKAFVRPTNFTAFIAKQHIIDEFTAWVTDGTFQAERDLYPKATVDDYMRSENFRLQCRGLGVDISALRLQQNPYWE